MPSTFPFAHRGRYFALLGVASLGTAAVTIPIEAGSTITNPGGD